MTLYALVFGPLQNTEKSIGCAPGDGSLHFPFSKEPILRRNCVMYHVESLRLTLVKLT
jgi:hypothetical protein